MDYKDLLLRKGYNYNNRIRKEHRGFSMHGETGRDSEYLVK